MPYDPDNYHRRSIRLHGADYAATGGYFITICTQEKRSLFGTVADRAMGLNDAGRMVESTWLALPQRFPTIELDSFVIMPNHFHAVIWFLTPDSRFFHTDVGASLVDAQNTTSPNVDPNRAGTSPAPTLGFVIGAFKSLSTNAYIRGVRNQGWHRFDRRLWERNYYERISRKEDDLHKIRYYVETNPSYWQRDPNYQPLE
jgi:REP element-mobilizing transposase RayT